MAQSTAPGGSLAFQVGVSRTGTSVAQRADTLDTDPRAKVRIIWRKQKTTQSAGVRESIDQLSLHAKHSVAHREHHPMPKSLSAHPGPPLPPFPISSDLAWAWAALGEPTQSLALADPCKQKESFRGCPPLRELPCVAGV